MAWLRKVRPSPAADDARAAGTRVGFVAVLVLAMGIGPLLLHGVNAMSPMIVAELELSRAQFGTFAMAMFFAAAVSSGLVGSVVDKLTERLTLYVLFAGSAIAIWLAAAAQTYVWLLLAVMLSGLAQALSNPVTNRLVSGHTPTRRRGTIMGVKQAGVQMAQTFAGLALPALAIYAGWRGSMLVASILAVAGLLLSMFSIPREDTGVLRRRDDRDKHGAGLPAAVWWLAGYAFFSGAALQMANVYLPLYGYEALELSSTAAGALTAVVGALGVIARIIWGQVASRSEKSRLILTVLAVGATIGIAMVLLAEVVHVSLVWTGAAVVGGTGLAANVVLMVIILRVVTHDLIGRATGVLAIGLYLGFAVGPVAFGAIVDATGDYRSGWVLALASLVITGLLAIVRGNWATPEQTAQPPTT